MSPTLSMPTKYKIFVYMYDNYVIILLFYINMQNYNIDIQGNHVPMQLIYEWLHAKFKKNLWRHLLFQNVEVWRIHFNAVK